MSEPVTEQPATTLRRFKPYPGYRDSGAERLGEIPARRAVQRGREAAARLPEAPREPDVLNGPDLRAEGDAHVPDELEIVAEEAES